MLEPFPSTPPGSSLSATPTTSFHAQSLLATLPATVLARIFSSLSSADLLRCALVSKEWLVLASMEAWWEELALNELETPGLVSVMLHERAELPHLTHGSWRELYWKYRRKEALTLHPRVVAVYDYRARTENEIDVKRGEVLRLLAKDHETCWWLVQRTSDKAEPPQPPAAQQEREEREEEGKEKEKEKELKEEEEGVAKTKETTEGEEEEEGQGQLETAAGEPGLDEEQDDNSEAQPSADDERVADVTTDEQQQEQQVEEEKRGDDGGGGGAVVEPEGRKPAATIGWVPSGYLDYCPRKPSAARARRSEAAAADAQDARQLQERNKKVPFMVRAKFDYVGANAQELSFKKYDLMAIELHPREKYPIPFDASEDDDGDDGDGNGEQAAMAAAERADATRGQWWKASLTRRSTTGGTTTVSGWIPVNLVTEEVTHVIALFDYVPVDEEELPLKKGQRVAVLATDENRKGWIYAQGNGRRGWLPENYVVDDDDA